MSLLGKLESNRAKLLGVKQRRSVAFRVRTEFNLNLPIDHLNHLHETINKALGTEGKFIFLVEDYRLWIDKIIWNYLEDSYLNTYIEDENGFDYRTCQQISEQPIRRIDTEIIYGEGGE